MSDLPFKPSKPPRPCPHPGCRTLTYGGRCQKHARLPGREFDEGRGTSTERGYDQRWRRAREGFLRLHPLCACPDCESGAKRVTPATVVDHTIPHRGDPVLFWDESNWKPYAKPCHDRKTAREINDRRVAESRARRA